MLKNLIVLMMKLSFSKTVKVFFKGKMLFSLTGIRRTEAILSLTTKNLIITIIKTIMQTTIRKRILIGLKKSCSY